MERCQQLVFVNGFVDRFYDYYITKAEKLTLTSTKKLSVFYAGKFYSCSSNNMKTSLTEMLNEDNVEKLD